MKSAGDMPVLVKSNYARNVFHVMRAFGLTPASPDFYNMTPDQLDFMVLSLAEDIHEQDLAAHGKEEDSFAFDPDYDYEGEMEFGGVKNDEDQIRKLLGEDAFKKRDELFNNALEGMNNNVARRKQEQAIVKEQSDKQNDAIIRKNKGNLKFSEDNENIDTI